MTARQTPSSQSDESQSGIDLPGLLQSLRHLREDILLITERFSPILSAVHPAHAKSARNLLGYLSLRRHDIRDVQEQLAGLGLSSLGRAEAHVLSTLNSVIRIVCRLASRPWKPHPSFSSQITRDQGRRILRDHTEALLGPSSRGRSVRIMVTMPAEAASDYSFVKTMLKKGMNCARINCAHDGPEEWKKMIDNLRRAERETRTSCRILMDLAGPKLRTGPLAPGPRVVKWRPRRDPLGNVTSPARIWLKPAGGPDARLAGLDAVLSVSPDWLARLKKGDEITFTDSRKAARSMTATLGNEEGWLCESRLTSYVTENIALTLERFAGKKKSATGVSLEDAPDNVEPIVLRRGDTLLLTRELAPGRPAIVDARGREVSPASIGCTLPEVFADVKVGHAVWLDDGKIGGVVKKRSPDRLAIEITHARPKGERLRGEKGINFPDTTFRSGALSGKDVSDLEFAVKHADVVGISFVQRISDVNVLQKHLASLGGESTGILLKIETQRGFELLPDLLLAAMRNEKVGVMIARGDLAVECGWERLAEVQEEILWICEAAHVPVVWATQVLETLAKDGLPSRAEITDAAMGQRAECVMLNKGPHILEAIRILDDIMRRMQSHQRKKRTLLRRLGFWSSPKKHLTGLQSLPGGYPIKSHLYW
jgi:pyruvate kinase